MENESVGSASDRPSIIFEDDNLLIINKPSGLVVHNDGRTVESSLSDWVEENHPGLKDVGGLHTLDTGRYVPRFGILHRLDRETSGVLVIAKNDEAFFFLQRQFIEHTNIKTYNAFVWGVFEQKYGVIELPIGRSRSDFRQWATGDDARGTLRRSTTNYRVLKQYNDISYVSLTPETGRTHQLRVHMKAIGHPILCDKRYHSATALGFDRVALHARSITFEYPKGIERTFEAPLPPDFEKALGEFNSHQAQHN
jgi:23S rRNA pseudouridine1911/1915/1917 synthase